VEHNKFSEFSETRSHRSTIHRLHGVVEVGWSSVIMHTVHNNDTQLELNPPACRQPVQL